MAGLGAEIGDQTSHAPPGEQHRSVGRGQVVGDDDRVLGRLLEVGRRGLPDQVLDDAIGYLVEVRPSLRQVPVVPELLADLPEGAAHRPLGVEQLVAHQRARTLQDGRVVRHHPVRVEDVPLLALAQALADRAQLLDAVADGLVQAGKLGGDLVGGDVVPRHTRAAAVEWMHLPDGDTGRGGNADELGQAAEAYQFRPAAGVGLLAVSPVHFASGEP